MNCPERDKLQADAKKTLEQLIVLTNKQISALNQNDSTTLMALDKQLENAFGAKERSFGALSQHTKDHGC